MNDQPRILPRSLVAAVDFYVECELADAVKYDNKEPLDESGVWALHTLAAKIYAAGWADGEAAESERARHARARDRDRAASQETPSSKAVPDAR